MAKIDDATLAEIRAGAARAAASRDAVKAGERSRGADDESFPSLGIRIRNGSVYKGALMGGRLGSLAGAHAEVTDVHRVHRVKLAAVTLTPIAALAKKHRALALIVFPDGTSHTHALDGRRDVANAMRDAATFNALTQR